MNVLTIPFLFSNWDRGPPFNFRILEPSVFSPRWEHTRSGSQKRNETKQHEGRRPLLGAFSQFLFRGSTSFPGHVAGPRDQGWRAMRAATAQTPRTHAGEASWGLGGPATVGGPVLSDQQAPLPYHPPHSRSPWDPGRGQTAKALRKLREWNWMEPPGRPQCVLASMPLWAPFTFCFQEKRGRGRGIITSCPRGFESQRLKPCS